MRMHIIAFVAVWFGITHLANADFLFQRIVDTSTTGSLFAGSVNNSGQVAYWSRTGSIDEIRVWNAQTLTTQTIATADTSSGNFLNFRPSINNLGVVAHGANSLTLGNRAFTTVVATGQSTQVATSGNSIDYVAVNDRGTVAYVTNSVVWVRPTLGPTTTPGNSQSIVVLNNNDQVLRWGGTSMVLDSTPVNSLSTFVYSFPSMNDAGQIAYVGQDNNTTNPVSLYVDTLATSPVMVVDGNQFTSLSSFRPAINNQGSIAFLGARAGVLGMYLNGQNVISVGDALDGSTVTSLGFATQALNDSDQISFVANLADGRQGLYLTTTAVPEPTSILLFSLLASACATRAIKQRTIAKRLLHESPLTH